MSVRKYFWEDPYATVIKAKVTSVAGPVITVDQTVAFAFSGGQASDQGAIGGYAIEEAVAKDQEIYYTIAADHDFKVGQKVDVAIDWNHRYAIMKLHFAAELILEMVYQDYGHPEKIGANITATKSRVDFFWTGSIAAIFDELSAKVNAIIAADLPIVCDYQDESSQRRYWKIDGFAKIPCGGTHIKSTGEIGPIVLKRKNIGKGKERIEIQLQSGH